MPKNKYEKSLIFVLFLFCLFSAGFLFSHYKQEQIYKKIEQNKKEYINKLNTNIKELSLEAKAISIYDITWDKKLYAQKDDIKLPLASLAKIMSAWILLGEVEKDIQISKKALQEIGDNGLYLDERWALKDLLGFSLITSSNDGFYALTENQENFIKEMNQSAIKMGFYNMEFQNATGLDLSNQIPSALGTAEEVNQLSMNFFKYHREIALLTSNQRLEFISLSQIKHIAENTNPITKNIPNLLFSKTGNTLLAGGNLSIIFKDHRGHEIAMTILGSSPEGRFLDILKLVDIINQISI